MNCREICSFLDDYLDGSLEPEVAERFNRHMDDCPPCREYLDSYRDTVNLTRSLCEETGRTPQQMPDDLVKAILDATRGGDAQSDH